MAFIKLFLLLVFLPGSEGEGAAGKIYCLYILSHASAIYKTILCTNYQVQTC